MCGVMWDVEPFNTTHKYFKDAKAMQIREDFKVMLKLIWKANVNQPPKTIGILSWKCDEFSRIKNTVTQ